MASQGNFVFLQGQEKVREFSKIVEEILNTKKIREKSGNFPVFDQNCDCVRYFIHFEGLIIFLLFFRLLAIITN